MNTMHRYSRKTKIFVGCLRLNQYPHGLGKGHDAGVVGAWLDEELGQVQLALIEAWPKTSGGSWAGQSVCFILMEKLELNNINNSTAAMRTLDSRRSWRF